MEMIRRFPDEAFQAALKSWTFIDLERIRPAFTSPFGDIFFEGDTGYSFLDIVGGELRSVCTTGAELQDRLNTRDGQAELLMMGLAAEADASGLILSAGSIYDFRVPPVLGGAVEVENLQVMDFSVAVNLAGQIHRQVRDLPPGTPISGLQLD